MKNLSRRETLTNNVKRITIKLHISEAVAQNKDFDNRIREIDETPTSKITRWINRRALHSRIYLN